MPIIPHAWLIAVTDLGDSAVLCGVVLITTIYLLISGCRRTAAFFLLGFLISVAGISLLKIFFFSCHSILATSWDLRSPSGHAALTATVWGGIGMIIARQYSGWRRWIVLLPTATIIGMIALTRWMLRFHSDAEVITGLLVGLSGIIASWIFLRRAPAQKIDPRGLLIAVGIAALALHGLRLPAESLLQHLAQQLQIAWAFCDQKAAGQ